MADAGEPLSDREQAVLERLADGLTNRQIAQALSISPNTVKVHVRNIFVKLDVSSRTEATTVAIQQGLLSVPGAAQETPAELEEEATSAEPEIEGTAPAEPQNGDATARTSERSWRFALFVLILAVGLLIGAAVGAWLLNDSVEPTPPAMVETADAPFIPQPVGDTNWRVGRPLSQERANMAVASIGLDLYVIGGEVEAGIVNLVDVYETNGGLWHSAAPKPTAVSDTTAAVLFGEIYVPGGRLTDGQPTALVEAYSPANDAWRPVAPLPNQVAGGLALSDGSRLYLLGGWDGESYLANGYVYDPEADAWQSLPPMTIGRAEATGDIIGDRLYVVGGFNGQQELDACEYFDVAESVWSTCANMNVARAGAGASAQGNDFLYVIGGGKGGNVPQGEVYDVGDDSWAPVIMPMLEAGESWHDLGVVSVETHIYALGGRQDESIVPDNYTYIPFIHRTYLPSVGSDN